MADHYEDHKGIVHFLGLLGADYTLCGDAIEGERGDTPMRKVHKSVTCSDCIGVVEYCKNIRKAEIAPYLR